jgi:hypothetical protein
MKETNESSIKEENINNDSSNKEVTNIEFPAVQALLLLVQREYEYESDRAKSFENRTGYFLTFSGALLVFLLTNFKVTNITNKNIAIVGDILPYVMFIIFIALTFLILLASIFCFIMVISIHEYNRIKLDDITEEYARNIKENVEMGLVLEYKDVIAFNVKTNNKKVRWYKAGIYLILSSLIFTVITFVLFYLLS